MLKTHLVLAIPAYDGVLPTQAVNSIVANAYQFSQRNWVLEMALLNNCSLVQKARNHLVHMFLHGDGTHMMCVDSDISWNPHDLMKLIKHSAKYPVIAGVYPSKSDELKVYADYERTDTGDVRCNEEGLGFAKSIPAGFMLLRRDVVEDLAKRYASTSYLSTDGEFSGQRIVVLFDAMLKDDKYYGEDVIFCQRLRESGYDIMVDPTIILNHHGKKIYSLGASSG